MRPHRLPRPVRLAIYALASGVLLYICLAPSETLPEPGIGDKWEHTIGWMALTGLGLALSPRRPRAIVAYALSLALAIELLQSVMGLGRHGDWRDLIADALGVAAACALAWPLRRRFIPA